MVNYSLSIEIINSFMGYGLSSVVVATPRRPLSQPPRPMLFVIGVPVRRVVLDGDRSRERRRRHLPINTIIPAQKMRCQ